MRELFFITKPEATLPFVFINNTGTQMTQSNIRSSLTAAFSKSGFSDFVTNTKLRKSAVTVVHDKYKGEKSNVALHMCHAEETAKKFYRMVEKGDNSIACARILKNITTQSMPSRIVDSDCHVQDTQNLMLNLSQMAAVM